MELQNFERKNQEIKRAFEEIKSTHPDQMKDNVKLSWSNWGFGQEKIEDTLQRLSANGISYIELHGNRYGTDLGDKFATPEPLGPGGDPYPAMHGKPRSDELNEMVSLTASYLRSREQTLKQ